MIKFLLSLAEKTIKFIFYLIKKIYILILKFMINKKGKDMWLAILAFILKMTLWFFEKTYEILKTFIAGPNRQWIVLTPLLIIFYFVFFNWLNMSSWFENLEILLFLPFFYYIVAPVTINTIKWEWSILQLLLWALPNISPNISEKDRPYYEWMRKNWDKLEKLKKSIYEIYRLNNLLIKGDNEEETKYILISWQPKIIDLNSDELEIKYILPNGLPFTKIDNDNIKQSILQVFQKYFPNIWKIELSIKWDVMNIRSIRASGSADFSQTFKFPNLLIFNYEKTYENPLDFSIWVDEDWWIKKYDLAKMPHLLVASETWWGKSSAITNILASLMQNRVEWAPVDFTIIDPKKVEFALYRELWGFKVETNYEKALVIMAELCQEMDNRYEELMQKWVKELKTLHNRGENLDMRYKVLIIDEFADIMTDPKVKNEFEMYVKRLTALWRACWIHLILATQNPTAEIVTWLIKANIPARLWLKTSDSSKSRIILDSWELANIKETWEAYIKTKNWIEHIKNFYISEEEVEKFIRAYKNADLMINWEVKQNQIEEKDKYDLLFDKMKTFQTFKISWYREIENFTENNFRNMSKFFQEKWIIEKLIWNKIELKNEILLDENLKKELEKIL